MKVGIQLGKVKKFGIGWCIHHIMAADNAAWNRAKSALNRFWKSVSSKTAVAPSSRFCESETLFQIRSRAKH